MNHVEDLVATYHELFSQYGHAPRRGGDDPRFIAAQRQLWLLAQAICQLTHPQIQAELDAARRDAIAQIRLHVENASPVVVSPRRRQRPITWADIQLTPELSVDPTTVGACVTVDVAKRLTRAHKEQVKAVLSIVHRR